SCRADLGIVIGGLTIEAENLSVEIDIENLHRGVPESIAAFSRWQHSDAVENFAPCDSCREDRCSRLFAQPFHNARLRNRPQYLRQDVRIENDHLSNSMGSRIASRGAISSSRPPKGSMRARMASTNPFVRDGSMDSAVRRMSRASSSIERPCRAAWMRS